jgi:hypothetical protein
MPPGKFLKFEARKRHFLHSERRISASNLSQKVPILDEKIMKNKQKQQNTLIIMIPVSPLHWYNTRILSFHLLPAGRHLPSSSITSYDARLFDAPWLLNLA